MIKNTISCSVSGDTNLNNQSYFLSFLQVETVNQLASQLLQNEHPNAEDVVNCQDQLNQKWNKLQDVSGQKRNQLNAAHGVSTWHIECQETMVSN